MDTSQPRELYTRQLLYLDEVSSCTYDNLQWLSWLDAMWRIDRVGTSQSDLGTGFLFVASVHVDSTAARLTSGSASSNFSATASEVTVGPSFCKNSGPVNQQDFSINCFAVSPRDTSSAGLQLVSTYRHGLGSDESRIYWTRFATYT